MQETKLCHSLTYFLGIVRVDTFRRSQPDKLLQSITSVLRVFSEAGEAIDSLCDTVEDDNRCGLAGTAS